MKECLCSIIHLNKGLRKGVILTKSLEKEELIDRREILFIPIYKFLLDESLI